MGQGKMLLSEKPRVPVKIWELDLKAVASIQTRGMTKGRQSAISSAWAAMRCFLVRPKGYALVDIAVLLAVGELLIHVLNQAVQGLARALGPAHGRFFDALQAV